jgi:hypothetical protein
MVGERSEYPRTVRAALLKLDELGCSESWSKFAMVGRYNTFRLLKKYQLVEDANEPPRKKAMQGDEFPDYPSEPIWDRFPTLWILTTRGHAAVKAIKECL